MSKSPPITAACEKYLALYGEPNRVYCPGCGNDASPSVVFPNATIVYLDPNVVGLAEIKDEFPDAEVVHATAEEYAPKGEFGLVVSMRAHAPMTAQIRSLRVGGHVLIDNTFSERAFESPGLELIAAITEDSGMYAIIAGDMARFLEVDPDNNPYDFTNSRKEKAAYYVFRKK